jgi:carbon monoxide dehydrogenase subunit G
MRVEDSFEVAASPDEAWSLLMDVPRVIPCLPGAELTETVDESNWKATMAVKLGPVSLTFATDVTREDADAETRRARLSARARELRGRGSGQATIESTVTPTGAGTRVDVVADMALSGAIAQYGRGIVQPVASQMIASFARCLEAQLTAAPAEAEAAVAAQAKPVSGLSLGVRALGQALAGVVRRLFRR